eukprot:gene7644-8485_t
MANDIAYKQLLCRDIHVRFGGENGADRETKLKIFIGFSTSSSGICKKELHIRLTDDNDPFFLQFLYLNNDDFQSLKTQQGLLVDFSAFPQKLIDLVDMCSKEENNSTPRFLLQFKLSGSDRAGNGILDIIETNPFKHLTHLSLKFFPGGDEEVKRYLAKCLKNIKNEKESLLKKVQCLETDFSLQFSAISQKLQEKTEELENLKSDWTIQLDASLSKHHAELTSAKEYGLKLQSSYEEKMSKERESLKEKHRNNIDRLEKRIIEVDASNKDLLDNKYKNDALIRGLQSRVSNFEEECHHMNKDIQNLRRQNASLNSERHEKDKTFNHVRTRVAVLEQELKDKEEAIIRSSELHEISSQRQKVLDGELQSKIIHINKLDVNLKSVSDEVLKGNEIIRKLQNELRNAKSQASAIMKLHEEIEELNRKSISAAQEQHHSTPSGGYLPYVRNMDSNMASDLNPNQVLYRPSYPRKPVAWQSPPLANDLKVQSSAMSTVDNRLPLRQHLPNNQGQSEPAVDLKYLQTGTSESIEVENSGIIPRMHSKTTIKPFPISGSDRNGTVPENN